MSMMCFERAAGMTSTSRASCSRDHHHRRRREGGRRRRPSSGSNDGETTLRRRGASVVAAASSRGAAFSAFSCSVRGLTKRRVIPASSSTRRRRAIGVECNDNKNKGRTENDEKSTSARFVRDKTPPPPQQRRRYRSKQREGGIGAGESFVQAIGKKCDAKEKREEEGRKGRKDRRKEGRSKEKKI